MRWLRAQGKPATLILTVTSGLHITRVRHVYNMDAENGSWNLFWNQERSECKKCVNHISLSHGMQASVTWKVKMRSADITRQFVTWDPSFCHPGTNFHGKKWKTLRSSKLYFFVIRTWARNIYKFILIWIVNEMTFYGYILLLGSTKISDYPEQANPAASHTLQKSLEKSWLWSDITFTG